MSFSISNRSETRNLTFQRVRLLQQLEKRGKKNSENSVIGVTEAETASEQRIEDDTSTVTPVINDTPTVMNDTPDDTDDKGTVTPELTQGEDQRTLIKSDDTNDTSEPTFTGKEKKMLQSPIKQTA